MSFFAKKSYTKIATQSQKQKGLKKMDKNQNGFPGSVGQSNLPCNPPNRPGANNNAADMNGGTNGNGCGGDMLDAMPLAYVYAPNQRFQMLYSAPEALRHGTLFEELYKPMEVYGREQ